VPNIILAIVGLTVVNSTFVILPVVCEDTDNSINWVYLGVGGNSKKTTVKLFNWNIVCEDTDNGIKIPT
jgi:hypothetical protein